MLMYKPFVQAEGGDDAIWDYVSQSIVRGQVPYRDVIEIKTPASAYLSAAAILIGRTVGSPDIVSIRVLYILLVGILCTVMLLTARAYFESTSAGLIAVLILLSWEGLAVMMVAGTRPKVPMTIFGLMTLLLIAKDRPFWAGFCSMLSCLCWQPGLLFTAMAVLVLSRYLTRWRDLRAIRVLAGATLPLGVTLIYFFLAGALGDMWRWTVTYNYSVYMPETHEGAALSVSRFWSLIDQVTSGHTLLIKLGIAGLLMFGVECIWVSLKDRGSATSSELFKHALVVLPLAYFAFKLISYPGADDLILFLPFLALFAGYLFTVASRLIGEVGAVRRTLSLAHVVRWIRLAPVPVLIVICFVRGVHYRGDEGSTLQDQQREVKAVAQVLNPDDKIYVHGTLEILVLLNKPNMNRYIFLDRGKDTYIAQLTPGGFNTILEEMKNQHPKVVAISRVQNVAHRDDLLAWAAEEYERLPVGFAHNSVYVRKRE